MTVDMSTVVIFYMWNISIKCKLSVAERFMVNTQLICDLWKDYGDLYDPIHKSYIPYIHTIKTYLLISFHCFWLLWFVRFVFTLCFYGRTFIYFVCIIILHMHIQKEYYITAVHIVGINLNLRKYTFSYEHVPMFQQCFIAVWIHVQLELQPWCL